MGTTRSEPKNHYWLLAVTVVIGFNLRPALSSVGPIVEFIQLPGGGWDEIGAGLLVSLPLILFACATPLAWFLLKRWRLWDLCLISLCVLTAAILVRSFTNVTGLFAGTLAVGVGIGTLNVILPVYVRKWTVAGHKPVMNFYTASLSIGAAIAAGATLPISMVLNLEWQASLSIWAVSAAVATIFWGLTRRRLRHTGDEAEVFRGADKRGATGCGIVALVIFFGSQSALYYTTTTWLPVLLEDGNLVQSGYLLSIVNWTGIPAAFLAPYLCRRASTLPLGVGIGAALWMTGLSLLLFTSYSWIGAAVVGLAQGTTLSFGLGLIVVKANSYSHSIAISGIVQGFGYLLAAVGPVAVGAVLANGGATLPVRISLLVIVVVMFVAGLFATVRPAPARERPASFPCRGRSATQPPV